MRSVESDLGQHRLDRAGHVDARGAPGGLAVERAAGTQVGGHVGDVHPEPDAAVLAPGGDRVVEVLGVVGVDREGGQRREVHAGVGGVGLGHGVLGLGGGRAPVAAVQAAVEHQPLDHVARAVGAAEHPQPRARRACPSPPAPGRPGPAGRAPRRCAGRARTAAPRRGSGRAARARPRTARRGGRRAAALAAAVTIWLQDACRARRAAPRRASVSRVVLRPHLRLDALRGDRLAAGQVVVGDGEVEQAAVREVDHLLDERPCRRCACRPPSRASGRAARRSRSRRRWRCRRPRARPPGCPSVDRVALGVLGAVRPVRARARTRSCRPR